ncbi:MAG TPA: ComEC/Rec2 family competence protein [Candidatus Obscuribacterales bacterium]
MWDPGTRLCRWLEIKPRITVVAAALMAVADALALGKAPYFWAVLLVLVVLLCGLLTNRRRLALLLAIVFGGMYGWCAWRIALEQRKDLARTCTGAVLVTAEVESVEPTSRGDWYRVVFSVFSVERSGGRKPAAVDPNTLALAQIARDEVPADVLTHAADGSKPVIQIWGTFHEPRVAQFPWEFDERKYLQRQGIACIFRPAIAAKPCVVSRQPPSAQAPFESFIEVIRTRMVDLHRKVLGGERGDLLSSMVIGDKAVRPSKDVRDQFRMLGLSHIVAASGFNLTVVTAVAWWTLRFIVRSAIGVSVGCLAAIVLFCALAGLSASVERAAIMCMTMLVIGCTRRSVYLPASVSLSAMLALIVDPFTLVDAGAQLSYVATMAIALAVRRLNHLLAERLSFPGWLAEAVVVVLLANASVLPIQMIYFWQVGQLSLAANVLVSPLVPIVTVLGFISSALAPFQWLPVTLVASGLDWIAGWPLDLMMCIVRWLSLNRWSLINVGVPSVPQVIVYYLALFALFVTLPARTDSLLNKRFFVILCVYSIAYVYLFFRPCLRGTTIVCSSDSMIILPADSSDSRQNALILGNTDNVSIRRAETYLRVRDPAEVPLQRIPDAILQAFPSRGRSAVFQLHDGKLVRVHSADELYGITKPDESNAN